MIAATGLKRLVFGVAALIVVSVAAVAVIPILIPADHVRDAVQAEIRSITGLDPRLNGETTVSLFPARVSLGQVTLGDDRGAEAALTAERLIAQLRLLPLLIGRIEIADVSLIRPRIAVTFDPQGRSNWSTLADSLTRTLKPGAKRPERLSFSEIRIADGTVFIHDEKRGIAETLADVEFSLAWPSISRSFGATGRFWWRNEPVDASFSLSDLFAAVAGDRSGFKLRLSGAPFKLAYDGHLSHRPTLKVEGTLAADATSLRQALRWSGVRSLPGGGLGRFALRAQTNVAGSTVALTAVNLELDGNTVEGVLAIGNDGRPSIQGTLAADALDLTPYVSTFRFLTQDEREWSTGRLRLDGLTAFDVDLRLSAAKIALRGAKLGRTGIAVNLRNGNMALTIGESQAFGGVLKGSVALGRSDTGVALKAQRPVHRRRPGKLPRRGLRRPPPRGHRRRHARPRGSRHQRAGPDPHAERPGHHHGEPRGAGRTQPRAVAATARAAAVVGAGISAADAHRSKSSPSRSRSRRAPRHRSEVQIEGSNVRVAVAGTASIPTRDLDLKGTATLVTAEYERSRAVRAAVRGAGTLGGSGHAARRADPDPALGSRRPAARCRARAARTRCGPLGDRFADPHPAAGSRPARHRLPGR